jgi:large subunit ribosomal protein L17
MRHAKHRHQLGRKKEHRQALMANLAVALIINKRIKTTLPKAKALRPFIEKIITFAKKAHATDDKLKKHHFRKLALSKVRDIRAVNRLFNDLAEEFAKREGGYTRIYKLVPRLGDAADMALIEFIDADDEGYSKRKSKSAKSAKKDAEATADSEESESTEGTAEVAEETATEEESKQDVVAEDSAAETEAVEEDSTDSEQEAVEEADTSEEVAEAPSSEDTESTSEEDSSKEEK